MSFIDHARKTVYVRASASNEAIKASQIVASALGYKIVYNMASRASVNATKEAA
jgi:hypothetical protein